MAESDIPNLPERYLHETAELLYDYPNRYDYRAQQLGSTLSGLVKALRAQATQEYQDATQQHGIEVKEWEKLHYPEVLKDRDPHQTRVVVLNPYFSLGSHETGFEAGCVKPLIRVLSSEEESRWGYIRYARWGEDEDQFAMLEENGIDILSLDSAYHEVVENRPWRKKLKVNTLSEETVIALFGLTREDHGDAEIVLGYTQESGHSLSKLVEAVERRTGKIPHILKEQLPYGWPHEGSTRWIVHELQPPRPVPPQRATFEEMKQRLMDYAGVSTSAASAN